MVSQIDGDFRDATADFLDLWHSNAASVGAEAVAVALVTAAKSELAHRHEETVEIVWTGPEPTETRFRQTEQAILEVVNSATRRLRPYDERKEQATARYQEKLDQLEAVRRAMKAGSNRMRGAAVARLFSRIVVKFDQTRKRGGWLPDETEFHLWHVKEAVRHALTDQLTEVEEEFLHLGDVKKLIVASDIPGLSVDAKDEKSQEKPSDSSGWSAGRRRSC